ncbi:O-antigen ligase family protein [Geodermatophilus sp. URMC 60]
MAGPRLLRRCLAQPSTWVALSILMLPVYSGASPLSPLATGSDLIIVVAIVLTGWTLLRGERLDILRSVPAIGFLLLGTASLVVTALATNFPQNIVGGARFLELFVLIPLAVMTSLRRRADLLVVGGSIVALALVEGTIGLVQAATGTGAAIGTEHTRAVGTFGAYNIGALAGVTGVALVVCLAVATVRTGRLRWAALAGSLWLSLALLATLTRGAWVAATVAAVVVLSRGRPARLVAAVAAGLLTAAVALPALAGSDTDIGRRVDSLLSAESAPDQSLLDRLALWRAAQQMTLDRPLTGIGPRAFPEHRDAYADLSLLGSSDISFASDLDFQQVALKSPHSLYLLIASEQGLIVVLLYGTLAAVLLVRGLVRASRRRSDASTSLALIGAGLLTYELVNTVTGDIGGPGSLLIGIALGVAGWAAADIDLVPQPETGPDPVAVSSSSSEETLPTAQLQKPPDPAVAGRSEDLTGGGTS